MKTVAIVLLALVAIVSCNGGSPNDNPEKVHVVDYNPIGDQVYNSNGNGKFVPDSFFYQGGNSGFVDNGTPQNRPYPYKKYDNPHVRGGK